MIEDNFTERLQKDEEDDPLDSIMNEKQILQTLAIKLNKDE